MADTLTAVSVPVNAVFVATAGGLPVIFVVNGNTATQAVSIDTMQYGLMPAAVNINTSLSPDGDRVSYDLEDGVLGSPVIEMADLATLNTLVVVSSDGADRFKTPIWHPNSQNLAMVKTLPADDDSGEVKSEIWTMTRTGSGARRVYGDDVQEILGYSADGSKLFITRNNPEPFQDFIYSALNLQDGSTSDISLERNVEGTGECRALQMQFYRYQNMTRLIYALSPSPYLQSNQPTPIRVADAETGTVIATVQTDSAVSDIHASCDLTLFAYTTRTYDDQGQVAGSAIWVSRLDGSEPPKNILPTQPGIEDYNVVAWAGDNSGVFVTSGPATVQFIGLDGTVQQIINQSDLSTPLPGSQTFSPASSGGVQAFSAGAGVETVISVPYVHQLRNTPENFNGNWACGPTSAVMVLAAYGLLQPRNDEFGGQPTQYGWYVSTQYTNSKGTTFSRTQTDPGGHPFAGAYGSCTNNGEAWGQLVATYLSQHGISARSVGAAQDTVRNLVRQNKPVILGTTIHGFGHVLVVKGLMSDGRFICNDPYWRKRGAGDDVYAWWEFGSCPFMIVVDRPVGAQPQPQPQPQPKPQPPQPQPQPSDSIPPVVGSGLPFDKQKRFVDAYKRNGGQANLGTSPRGPVQVSPTKNLRYVQDFNGGAWGTVLMVLDDSHDQPNAQPVPVLQPAFAVRGAILKKYRDAYGGSSGPLGSIMSDEFINAQGQHQVNFEGGYITWDGTSAAANDAFAWPDKFDGWKAQYYNNPGLAGSPSFIRNEAEINYDWGTGGPDGGKIGILATSYSVRWTRTVTFEQGTYTFNVTTDDGFRLLVNGTNVSSGNPDQFWIITGPNPHSFNLPLNGDTTIELQYFQWEGGAVARLNWQKIG